MKPYCLPDPFMDDIEIILTGEIERSRIPSVQYIIFNGDKTGRNIFIPFKKLSLTKAGRIGSGEKKIKTKPILNPNLSSGFNIIKQV